MATLMILSLGELGTAILEAVARSRLFDTVFVASRDPKRAQERANNAIIGAGAEGFFPRIIATELDFNTPDFGRKLKQIAPDYLFSAPSLMPWWRLDARFSGMPFATFTALHLSLMVKLRDRLAEVGNVPFWIGASYPDVINAVLNRTGYGPDCGIGNVQEPLAKIQVHVAEIMNCAPQSVRVQLVAQHAFEYFVLNAAEFQELPPYLLKATLDGEDVSAIAAESLRRTFPFPYDLHFNRVTASAGIQAFRALTSDKPTRTHLPGIGRLVGGYPVLASISGITLDLPREWTLEEAVAANEASLRWDGIDEVTGDGIIVYSESTRAAMRTLLGYAPEDVTVKTVETQARDLMAALQP